MKFAKLLEFLLCEDENMASNDFFGTMRRFIHEFRRAAEQVEKDEKAKVRPLPLLNNDCITCVAGQSHNIFHMHSGGSSLERIESSCFKDSSEDGKTATRKRLSGGFFTAGSG